MEEQDDIVIVAATRSPMGSMMGSLSNCAAPSIAAQTHQAALIQSGMSEDNIDEVIMGCVLSAGIGQAPARQSARFANLKDNTPATTINKMCGSGMKAVMMGMDAIRAGSAQTVLAGGMENMSRAPYLVPKARQGYRLGHAQLMDSMFLDGLEDAYTKGQLMGVFADETANALDITRSVQDEFATNSMQRALDAQAAGAFKDEITPISIESKQGEPFLQSVDETLDPKKLDKLPRLKPAFTKQGTVTAGNASSIADGAASLILTRKKIAIERGLVPLAILKAHATFAKSPEAFTTAPIDAIKAVLNKANWSPEEVDLYEINEAFAVVTLAAMHALQLKSEQVNVHGGACALGHPIGASGARIIVTLIHALKQRQLKRGIAALCIGGGEATAVAIECT